VSGAFGIAPSLLAAGAALWALATVDAACAGFRDAAGRSLLLDKRAYYGRALLRGALFGQALLAVAAVALALLLAAAPDRPGLLSSFDASARRLLVVYVPYGALTAAAGLLRLLPSVDAASLASTLLFGPLLLARPVIAVAGVAWAILAASPDQRPAVAGFLVLMLALMLPVERYLGLLRKRRRGAAS
jgi:hypothetical protein